MHSQAAVPTQVTSRCVCVQAGETRQAEEAGQGMGVRQAATGALQARCGRLPPPLHPRGPPSHPLGTGALAVALPRAGTGALARGVPHQITEEVVGQVSHLRALLGEHPSQTLCDFQCSLYPGTMCSGYMHRTFSSWLFGLSFWNLQNRT